MAKPQTTSPKRSAPRLYLVAPPVPDVNALIPPLQTALKAADIAALLLRLPSIAERDLINHAKTAAAIVQPTGTALLLDGHAEIAARAGADGAHLTGIATFIEAINSLKPARIAGCGGLRTRHDAMLAGERGADYIMFGEPGSNGHRPSFGAIVERIVWWSELFEIPCVAYAETIDEVGALSAAGADFIAVENCVWNHPRGMAEAIAEAASKLTAFESVP